MGSLNHFSRVLREKEQEFVLPARTGLGCGLAFVGVVVVAILGSAIDNGLVMYGGPLLAVLFFGLGFWQGNGERKSDAASAKQGEVGALLAELHWMEKSKQLLERTHPRLALLLERATLARNEIIVAMKSEEWVRKGKEEPWKEVREGCLRTADEGWADVAWLGRNLFRRKGWRRDTFERNCADPEYGRRALASAESVVDALEQLAANVKGETETDQSVINRTRKRLEELMAAEAELGEEPRFLKDNQ